MKTTAAALRELQDYFSSLDPKPNVKEIAAIANMPYATAARYLNGTTKQGIPSSVRALALALDRPDIMEEVTAETPTKNADAWWIVEMQKELREDNLEELDRERKNREESEKRLLAELERLTKSKDSTIGMLMTRIDRLEADKAKLVADNGRLEKDVDTVRGQKRKYEAFVFILTAALALYFIIFDLPYPDSGITEFLLSLL